MHPIFESYVLTEAPDRVLLERAAHFARMHAEELPEDPPLVPEIAAKRARNLPPNWRARVWVVRNEGRIAAQAYLGWVEEEANRNSAYVDITVERELRGQGLGASLISAAVAAAGTAERSLLFAESSDRLPAGRGFLERLGFEPALENKVSQLDLRKLARDLVSDWISRGRERASDYEIETWDGPVPAERLVAFAELSNVMNSEPHGSLEVEDSPSTPEMIRDIERMLFASGTRRLIACARHVPTGQLAGFTELSWHPMRAAIVNQAGTGVVESHRGRSLGRLLKATNLAALTQANPSAIFVRTSNAQSNAPMLAINTAMGFEAFLATTEWQGRAPLIMERLHRGLDAAVGSSGTRRDSNAS